MVGSLASFQKRSSPHILYSLSSILVSEFTLELRQNNSVEIATNDISLPPIRSVSDMLQHIHQSIIVELGNPVTTTAGEEDIVPAALHTHSVTQSPDLLQLEIQSVHAPV